MFTNIFTCSRFLNPLLSEICKKSTDEYIKRITKKNDNERYNQGYNEQVNKLNTNPEIISSMVLNLDKNNYPPNSFYNFLPIFSFISVTYFFYTFFKSIKS